MPNTYPSLQYTTGLATQTLDGRVNVRASNGALKSRLLFPADKKEFDIQHELSSAQRDTLDTFYSNNRSLSFYYTPPGASTVYTVRFGAPPMISPLGSGTSWWVARVRLIEV